MSLEDTLPPPAFGVDPGLVPGWFAVVVLAIWVAIIVSKHLVTQYIRLRAARKNPLRVLEIENGGGRGK